MAEEVRNEIPAVPETANSQGQILSTAPTDRYEAEGQLILSSADVLTESVRGLGTSGGTLALTPTARALLVAGLEIVGRSQLAALQDAAALRAENKKLQEQVADLRVQLQAATSDLRAERSNSTLRLIMSSIGAVVLSFIPFAYDKAQISGAALCAIIGGLLVFAPWIHVWRFRGGRQ
jgi:hypothetical protein